MKIMVVDDEPLINQYIVQCIRNADPESEIVGAVTSGAKALKKTGRDTGRPCIRGYYHAENGWDRAAEGN